MLIGLGRIVLVGLLSLWWVVLSDLGLGADSLNKVSKIQFDVRSDELAVYTSSVLVTTGLVL